VFRWPACGEDEAKERELTAYLIAASEHWWAALYIDWQVTVRTVLQRRRGGRFVEFEVEELEV
jgi:hypothetical protein